MTDAWQKCPVCAGTGFVSRPPGIAGDQSSWVSSSAGPWRCWVCGGQGIIAAAVPETQANGEQGDGQ